MIKNARDQGPGRNNQGCFHCRTWASGRRDASRWAPKYSSRHSGAVDDLFTKEKHQKSLGEMNPIPSMGMVYLPT